MDRKTMVKGLENPKLEDIMKGGEGDGAEEAELRLTEREKRIQNVIDLKIPQDRPLS